MSHSSGSGEKVAFSLGAKKKKKKANFAVVSEEFGVDTTTNKGEVEAQRSSPLVIPLVATEDQSKSTSLLVLQRRKQLQEEKESSNAAKPQQQHAENNNEKKNEDEAAAQALMQSAANHLNHKQQTDASGTNFSAQGDLVISASNADNNKEKQQLEQDVQTRPDTLPVDSNVYQSVPISEFGAAMLRGMGWKGDNDNNKNNTRTEPTTMPRPHRLGLGATPKLPKPLKGTKTIRRPDQVERDERLQAQQREYEKRKKEQIRLDKQQTLQVGSIVYVNERRAKMIQLHGVPGLNRVLVQYEPDDDDTVPSGSVSVKRGDVSLIDRQELDERSFRELRQSSSSTKPDNNNNKNTSTSRRPRCDEDRHYRKSRGNDDHDSKRRDKLSRRTEYDDDRRHDRHDDRKDRDKEEGRRRRRRDGSPRSDSEERSSRKRQRRGDDRRESKKASKHRDFRNTDGDTHHHHWLIPNIRVRVISDKPAKGRQYKQKGLVLDVTRGGAAATLQMADGQVLDGIPERYLETALPKPGGKAIVLTGKHRYTKGSLLERGGGKGVIQVYEDMSVLTRSLDDIAEWCGPLDDDMAE